MKFLLFAGLWAIVVLVISCSKDVPSPFEVNKTELLPAPQNAHVQLGVGSIILEWSYEDNSQLEEFRVYRQDGEEAGYNRIASLRQMSFADTLLVEGSLYFYKIAAVDVNGFEGPPTEELSVTPAIFSIIIENGTKTTQNTLVPLQIIAPEKTSFMQLANDSTFDFSSWEPYNAVRNWQLSAGDGLKIIYALFRDKDGYVTKDPVTAKIILDTFAQIEAISHDGYGRILKAGDPLHIRLQASDIGGVASARIVNSDTLNGQRTKIVDVPLYDNGTRGDDFAGDGVYEVNYYIDRGLEVANAEVHGYFTDVLGNEAPSLKAPTTFVLSQAPGSVILQEPADANQSTPALVLRWSANNEADFSSYQVFRSENFLVTLNSTLLAEINDSKTIRFIDTTVKPSMVYYYSIYVFDTAGNYTSSNIVSVRSPENNPPKPVVLSQAIGDSTGLTLTWSPSSADDFANYQIFRSNTLPVDTSFAPIRIISNSQTTLFRDASVIAQIDYYYQIFVVDQYGIAAGSNTVFGRID